MRGRRSLRPFLGAQIWRIEREPECQSVPNQILMTRRTPACFIGETPENRIRKRHIRWGICNRTVGWRSTWSAERAHRQPGVVGPSRQPGSAAARTQTGESDLQCGLRSGKGKAPRPEHPVRSQLTQNRSARRAAHPRRQQAVLFPMARRAAPLRIARPSPLPSAAPRPCSPSPGTRTPARNRRRRRRRPGCESFRLSAAPCAA